MNIGNSTEFTRAYLDARGVATVRLDATTAGQRVYEKLGFEPEYPLTRYEGVAARSTIECHAEPVTAEMMPQLIELDRHGTGTDRDKLLRRLFEDAPESMRIVRTDGHVEGFMTMRDGANAIQIGPCVGAAHAGEVLLADALNRCAGRRVFVDVPQDHAGVEMLQANGLTAQRHFMRMRRGKPVIDRREALWASSGPEMG